MKRIISILIFLASLFIARDVFAATEFISTIDPDNALGTDYTSLSAWEAAVQSDLTTSTTKVFSYSVASSTIPDGVSVTGLTSGATASSTHMTASTTSSQIFLTKIVGTFLTGEQVYITSTGASSTYVILSNAGDSAIAVAKCRSTGGSADTVAVVIDGWTTATTTYIKIWTDPSDVYGRHSGKWDDSKYRIYNTNSSVDYVVRIFEDYVRIDGLQIYEYRNNYQASGIATDSNISNSSEIFISNNIIRAVFTGSGYTSYHAGIYLNSGGSDGPFYVFNNIIYDWYKADTPLYGIRNGYSTETFIFNNSIYNSNYGIGSLDTTLTFVKNNIVQIASSSFPGTFSSNSSNNISSDGTAPGTNSKVSTTVSFVNVTGYDFHLSPDDTAARNAGTSTSYLLPATSYDIDGTARGGAFDIGADEVPVDFTSIICENTAAGGNCASLDYQTLSQWEDKVEADLTASTTRVFGGSITGSLSENDTVYLRSALNGTSLARGYVVATTSDQILIDGIISSTTLPVISTSSYVWQNSSANYWTVSGSGDSLGASARAVGEGDGRGLGKWR